MPSQFLTAEWNNLIMANYIVDPAVLKDYLPAKTELDSFNGNVYVSLIGFMFEETRLRGFKIPFHINFEEVNLRFYVRYKDNGVWKRGAVFIKEIVPRSAISFIAKKLYNEKNITLTIKHFYNAVENEIELGYSWKYKNKWHRLEATTDKEALPMPAESEEAFIAEHYWGYSKYSPAVTFEYAVLHPAWKVYKVKRYLVDCDFKALYGEQFAMLQHAVPQSVFVAKGSEIAILKKTKL